MSVRKKAVQFQVVHPHAAGIDVGSRSHFVCLGRQVDGIREFPVFTHDLHQMAQWLKEHRVTTIAMESTGFYWKSLFLLLQDHGFEVILVNAAHVKNVRGKKSDIADCQWIWQLHTAGLLQASFQPDDLTEQLRSYTRHRRTLIEGASRVVSKMQKALVLMNIHLSVVLTDIVGKSEQDIIRAILDGQRNGKALADLANHRVKADKATIAKALTGHWQDHHLFELQQCWDMYHFHQTQMMKCDEKIDELLAQKVKANHSEDLYYDKKFRRSKNDPSRNVAKFAYQLTDGVDLTDINGVGLGLVLNILSEVGLNLDKFPSAKHFTSWLGLCPNKKISGGKVLSSATRKNKNRLAIAFRHAANAAGNQKDTVLSQFFRKMAYRKGRKAAIVATARKIAVIVFKMLTKRSSFQPISPEKCNENIRLIKISKINKMIKNMKLSPQELAFASA